MNLKPTLRYNRLSDIPLDELKNLKISLVFLDMDNTLAPWHSDCVPKEFYSWIEEAKATGITVALLTNSKGSNADSIGKKLNIDVYKNAKKPFKRPTLNLLKALGVAPENVLFVGDQLFTDVQLANSIKAKCVLTAPLEDREWWCTKVFNRSREKLVWRFLFKN